MLSIDDLVSRLKPLNPPATAGEIAAVEASLGPLPADYKAFLRLSDGYEGSPSEENYLALYRVGNLVEYNAGYEVQQTRPELFLFGSTGGGSGYFFDNSTAGPSVLFIDFISHWHDDAIRCGASFTDFLARQIAGRSPFERV